MKLSTERKQNFKVAFGWGVVWTVILTMGLCCAPMTVHYPRVGRGAYLPLQIAVVTDGQLGLHKCSWGKFDSATVVTAAHCVGDAQIWLTKDLPVAPSICVDEERDAAYLVVARDAPEARLELPENQPQAGDLVCYDSFYGRHNCGRIVRVFSDRFIMELQEPVIGGDSGSPIYTANGTVGVVSRKFDGKPVGIGSPLPRKCKQ